MNAILYSSTDSGAPVLSRTAGSINTIFKAVLVNGYGAKSPLGWSNPYNDNPNNVSVFQLPNGTQTYVQINDNAVGGDYSKAIVQAYKTMTSAYLGIEPCPYAIPPTTPCLAKDSTATTTSGSAIPWYIVGDDKGFWWIPFYRYLQGGQYVYLPLPAYIGDYIPLDVTNVYNFCLMTFPVTSASGFFNSNGLASVNTTYTYGYLLRDIGFAYGSVLGSIWCPMNTNSTSMGILSGTTALSLSPINGRNIGGSVFIQSATNILGVMPGILGLLFRYPSSYTIQNSDLISALTTDGTNQQLVLASGQYPNGFSSTTTGKIAFNTGSKFRYVF